MTFDPWTTEQPESTDGFSTVGAEERTSVGNVNVNTQEEITAFVKPNDWSITFRGGVEKVAGLAEAAHKSGLIKNLAELSQAYAKAPRPSGAASPAATPAAAQTAPAASNGGDGRTCAHGTMFYKQGTNRFGKPYTAYFCAAPRETPDHEKCKPIFV